MCDFSYLPKTTSVPTDKIKNNLMFHVKKYDDEQIILRGCSNDEYVYRREEKRAETYVKK